MGIQGLLPFLKKIHTPVNVSQFRGCTIAIDAYCWLHKGAFSCADKLALGEKTEQYVYYCMKYVDYLLRNGLKPILVFDGCHLPSKKDVETSRRERRELNRKRAAQLLREGKRAEARECLQRCIDVTPQMALELMNVCRARGVDCIVAPYEADAQLAYLNKAGIAQIIITEDSDLLLFGCEKVIFKMDVFGNGVLIEQSRLNEVVDIQDDFYTFDKFRYMCILSGCDYLPSLPGIGLAKACKVFKVARQTEIRHLLKKLPSYLKMNLVVTEDYIEGFIRADNTFLYQLSFDPLTHKLCPLTPYPPEVEVEELRYAGPYFSDERALQIALGNVDIHTHERIAAFDPKTYIPKYAKKQENEMLHMLSIWNPCYRPCPTVSEGSTGTTTAASDRPCLAGREMQVKNTLPKRSPQKHVREADDSMEVKTNMELAALYSAPKLQAKKRRRISGDGNVTPPPGGPTKDPGSFSIAEGSGENLAEKKQVLSPSKSVNQVQSRRSPAMTADEAFSLMEIEVAGDTTVEEKENIKNVVTPKRNKFAVSALAKRAKFNLDTPALPNIKLEVKSRYFGSRSSSIASCSSAGGSSQVSVATGETTNSSPCEGGTASEVNSTPPTSAGPHAIQEVPSSRSKAQQASASSSKNVPVLQTFSFRAEKKPSESKQKNSKAAASAGKGPQAQKANNSSPGSLFSWSGFKFTKSHSTPTFPSSLPASTSSNRPFKRVLSESHRTEDASFSSQKSDVQEEQGGADICAAAQNSSQKDPGDVPQKLAASGSKMPVSSDSLQQGDGDSVSDFSLSQSSAADMDASQRSNLYSIDSDCQPTSQDFVDLTDSETNSQLAESGEGGDLTSPTSPSQIPLRLPISTPKTTSGVGTKKCRVSGLSRGKKKATPGVDDRQQKIRDMFSQFAHQKQRDFSPAPSMEEDQWSVSGQATPSDTLLAHSTQTHRKLLL